VKYKPISYNIKVIDNTIRLRKRPALITFYMYVPALIFLLLAILTGWTEDFEGESFISNAGGFFIIFGALASLGSLFYNLNCGIDGKGMFYRNQSHYIAVNYLDPENLNNSIYKEAYEDCLSEIKNNTFSGSYWSNVFRELNQEIRGLKFAEQKAKSESINSIPRKDYVSIMKDTNAMYLKGFK